MFPSPFAFAPQETVLRHIFEQSVVGIFQSSLEGRNLLANPALAQVMGFASPAEMRDSITDIARQFYVDPDRRRQVSEMIAHNGGRVENCESQVWRKDRSVIWIAENTRIVIDPDSGQPVYLGSITDVSARKLGEIARAASAEQLEREIARRRRAEEALTQALEQALIVCDTAGVLDFCSERAALLFRTYFEWETGLEVIPASLRAALFASGTRPPQASTISTPRGPLVFRAISGSANGGVHVFRLEEALSK